jgi:hypothetical protein
MSLEELDQIRSANTSLMNQVSKYKKEVNKVVSTVTNQLIKGVESFYGSGEVYKKGERHFEVKVNGLQDGNIPKEINLVGESNNVLNLDRVIIQFKYGS